MKHHLSFAYYYWDIFDFENSIKKMRESLNSLIYLSINNEKFIRQRDILMNLNKIRPNNYFESLKDPENAMALIFTY